jgi:hypothetical protein
MDELELERLIHESLWFVAEKLIERGESESAVMDRVEILGAQIWAGLDGFQGHRVN